MQFIHFKYYLKYLFSIVDIKVHHLAQIVKNLDTKCVLFMFKQLFSVFNQLNNKENSHQFNITIDTSLNRVPADESAIITCFRA